MIVVSFGIVSCNRDTPDEPTGNPVNPENPNEPAGPEEPENPDEPEDPEPVLEVINYAGNSQNTHPKVLYFENGWKGYKYWMGYTPFPNGISYYENPCIAVSNDGYNWITPEGLTNPIDPKPEYGYNSDTHLVYREDIGQMEIWWRDVKDQYYDAIWRRVSKDGIHWSERENILDFAGKQVWRVSPAVVIEENRYVLYYSDSVSVWVIRSGENFDISTWSQRELIPIEFSGIKCWHLDVINTDKPGVHEMLLACYDANQDSRFQDLYYVRYDSNSRVASKPELIISHTEAPGSKFYRLYRSSLVKIDNYYRIYLASIDDSGIRYLSVTEGPTPTDMKGWKAISGK